MRIRLAWTKKSNTGEPVVFFTGLPPARPIWGSFSCSAAGQALVVWLGVSYLHFLTTIPPVPEVPILKARVLEIATDPEEKLKAPLIRIPDQGARSEKGKGRKSAAPGPGSRPAPAREGAAPAVEASAGPPAPPVAAPLREFRMPAVPAAQSAPQTLVQLDLPPTLDLHPQLKVPALVMLTSEPARKLAPKPFLAPPERSKTMPVPNQVALDLRPPIFDAQTGLVKISPDAVLRPDPKLPAPIGGVSPVAGTHEPVPSTTQAATVTSNTPAPPVNVISLPDRPIPPGLSVVLPPLNQVSARDSASGDAGAGAAAVSARSNQSASGSDPSAAPRPNGGGGNAAQSGGSAGERDARGSGSSGRGTAADGSALARAIGPGGTGDGGGGAAGAGASTGARGAGSGSSGSGGGRGTSTSGTGPGAGAVPGPGAGTGPGRGPSSGAGSGTAAATRPTPIRLERPITGNYEVAVVQSSGTIPGTAGFLKGRPVYSVYLSLGGGKEWILQYCLPPEEKRPAQGQVIQLGTVAPLSAPFAYLILKPNIQLREGVRYGFIHAFVNKSGHFDQLAEVGDPVIEDVQAVIQSLEKWEFRPAAKDGAPAIVEVLLCIPSA